MSYKVKPILPKAPAPQVKPAPSAAPAPAAAPRAEPTPVLQPIILKWVKLADASYGLALIDPGTGAVYTHTPTPVPVPSVTPWLARNLERGVLVEL